MDMPLTEKALEWSNKLLVIFGMIMDKLHLTSKVQDTFPTINNLISGEALTLVLTVLTGLLIILAVYGILINLCKVTLNFLIFTQWAVVGVLVFGVLYNVFGG